jgi:predicted RNA-binding Zn-ribbon protein involved in translation (DUF1610 family)
MKSFSLKKLMAAAESGDYLGFCTACGAEAEGVEPDAREYDCDACGKPNVYGAEELIMMGVA